MAAAVILPEAAKVELGARRVRSMLTAVGASPPGEPMRPESPPTASGAMGGELERAAGLPVAAGLEAVRAMAGWPVLISGPVRAGAGERTRPSGRILHGIFAQSVGGFAGNGGSGGSPFFPPRAATVAARATAALRPLSTAAVVITHGQGADALFAESVGGGGGSSGSGSGLFGGSSGTATAGGNGGIVSLITGAGLHGRFQLPRHLRPERWWGRRQCGLHCRSIRRHWRFRWQGRRRRYCLMSLTQAKSTTKVRIPAPSSPRATAGAAALAAAVVQLGVWRQSRSGWKWGRRR